jgi:hypothetical protein
MNTFDEPNTNPVDIAAIDRLVAGELTDPERRDLLLKLEADPEGWRRCALAFLEDQTWRSALGSSATIFPQTKPIAPPVIGQKRPWLRWAAIAASVLALGFSAGFAVGGKGRGTVEVQTAQQEPSKSPISPPTIETDQVREVGWIDLVDSASGESPPRRVPIVSGPGLDEKWLRDQAPAVSDYVRARWERQGYQVQERRNLVSVLLDDGRQVTIPVDEVALDYVGQQPL